MATCRARLAFGADALKFMVGDTGRIAFAGLQRCGSPWACPVCGPRIAELRRQELNALLVWARAQPRAADGTRVYPIMRTLTARHGQHDALPVLLQGIKEAKRELRRMRGGFKAERDARAADLAFELRAERRQRGGQLLQAFRARTFRYAGLRRQAWRSLLGKLRKLRDATADKLQAKLADLARTVAGGRALAAVLEGSVTATEVTYGADHGWHPHFHEILLVRARSEAEAVSLVEELRPAWIRALATQGLTGNGHAFDVRSGAKVGDYVSKWGVAEEVALGAHKPGKAGRWTPAQLLQAAAGLYGDDDVLMNDDEVADPDRARALWIEFARAFKGRQQLVWSAGLKARVGLKELGDEAAAEPERRWEAEVARLGPYLTEAVMGANRRREHGQPDVRWSLLRVAQRALPDGVDAVQSAVDAFVLALTGCRGSPSAWET